MRAADTAVAHQVSRTALQLRRRAQMRESINQIRVYYTWFNPDPRREQQRFATGAEPPRPMNATEARIRMIKAADAKAGARAIADGLARQAAQQAAAACTADHDAAIHETVRISLPTRR